MRDCWRQTIEGDIAMSSIAPDPVLSILEKIGLRMLHNNFKKQKITNLDTCKQLTDTDLSHLGLSTIGDRAHFRAEVKESASCSLPTTLTNQGASTSTLRTFSPSRSGNRFHRGRKETRRKTWTANIMCLSDTDQKNLPLHSEKTCLVKAGLGLKKIIFDSSASESEVHVTLTKEFPKLSTSGGYGLMHCSANKRELKRIEVKWDVYHLKSVLGCQSRIYIRPVQNSLSLDINYSEEDAANTLEYPCQTCEKLFKVDELRTHVGECKTNQPGQDNDVTRREERDVITDGLVEQLYRNINMPPLNESYDNSSLFLLPDLPTTDPIILPELPTTDPVIAELQTTTESVQMIETSENITQTCIEDITNFQISDTIHALKYIQSKIVCGRKLDLDLDDLALGITGETNFIIVDRQNILSTGMEEIASLQNLRLTLEVTFYSENAEDFGGPRKEFFGVILQAIQKKYFDPIRDWLDVNEYKTVGKIFALSMLQNGQLPRILNADELVEFFGDGPRDVFVALGKGMDALGMFQILKAHSFMQHLMTPVQDPHLTLKKLMHLMQPVFEPEGSNQ